MSMYDKITLHLTGHPAYETTADGLDRAISRHLPGSPYTLRQKIDQHPANTFPAGHFDRLITVSEYLLVLAYFDDRES